MTGLQLFDNYQTIGYGSTATVADRQYAGTLMTARLIVGDAALFATLEQAERDKMRIDLTYPVDADIGPSEPSGIRLVKQLNSV